MSGEATSRAPEFVAVHYDGRIVGTRAHVIRTWPDRVGAWATFCGRISMLSREDRGAFSFASTRTTRKCGRCVQCLHSEPAPPVVDLVVLGKALKPDER